MDYRRFIRQAMMLTLTTGLLASCSKDNNVGEPEADELIEIVPSAAYTRGDGNASNAGSITGPVDNSMLEQLTFYFTRADYDEDYEDFVFNGKAYSSSCSFRENSKEYGDILFEEPQYYLQNGNDTKMIGWFPQGTISNTRIDITFDGKQDILISNELEGNRKNLGINGPNQYFTFQHQLTQLQFYATAESNVAQTQWGQVKDIVFTSENSTFRYIFLSRAITFISNNNSTISIKPTVPINIEANTQNEIGLVMLQPRDPNNRYGDASSLPIEFNITTSNDRTTPIIIDEGEFLAGHAYKVILNFKQGPTTITFEPAEWRELEQPIELGENLSHVISDMNYIVSRTMFGNANDYNGEILTVRDELWDTTPPEESKESVPVILEVATKDIEGKKTWEEACNACPEGWRLPCKKELQLIQQYKDMLTKVNTDDQTLNTPNGEYWSATLVSTGKAYYLNMEEPTEQTSSTEETYKVRCVRDVEM